MQYTYEYNGETISIKLERQPDNSFTATIGEQIYTVHASQVATGGYLLRVDDKRVLAHTVADSDARYVHVDGTQYQLNKVDSRRRKRGAAGSSGDLTAEMPGQVMDVRVAQGDSVSSGDVLVVLEAMKMEIRVTAPYDGTVDALHVNTGDVVERGQVLVEVSETEI